MILVMTWQTFQLTRLWMKLAKYLFIFLSLNSLFCTKVLSADCTAVSGTTVTITASCTDLDISGSSSDVTINSGITIDNTANKAVANTGTATTLTNSGTISATGNFNSFGLHNSGTIDTLTNQSGAEISSDGYFGLYNTGGVITTLTNAGTIKAVTQSHGIHNTGSSTITTLTNTGTISAHSDYGILNNGSSLITTLNNSGTISAKDDYGIRNNGVITTLDNSGTISTGDLYGLINGSGGSDGTITTLTNTGTISAENDYGLFNHANGSITTLTNSGTISADDDWGLFTEGTITTLTNSGTISAGDDYGLYHATGTITTLTNTGTISASGNNIGINNSSTGTITTLNNSQGASGSALTYDGKLPTNYNVIVNSTSDYGKIVFSSVSGTTTFGVDSSSTLADVDTTYSSVLSGLSSGDIASGTSGTFGSGALKKEWELNNISGTLWDLAVTVTASDDTNTSVTSSVKPNVILGINNLTSVTEVNFANMNTYDCDLFDKKNICLSLGGRHTAINTPKTRTNSLVWVGGYRLSDTLRVAGFYHRNLSHKTPASFTLSDKTPMTGLVVVWNQNPNKLGYQLKLANAYQQKNATLTREVVGSSEEGKGQTVIEAKSYVAELQYGYQFSDDTVLRPYFATRSAVIKQDAYTETGLSSPLSFNEIKDKSTTVLLGLKFNTHLSQKLSLKGSLGVEYDIEHSIDKLAPTGISGLSTVSLTDSFNKTRPVVSLGFDYALKPNHRLSGILQYQELPYESKTESNAYLYYTIGF